MRPMVGANEAAMVVGNPSYSPRVLRRPLGSDDIMAKQVITVLIDDLDGGDADRTIGSASTA
jgi:hypothetical protein